MKRLFIVVFIILLMQFTIVRLPQIRHVLSQYGSEGDEVTSIQQRLKSWGYYNGDIDGIYGWQTTNAVRLFQAKNNLSVDGVAGPQTLAAIGLPAGSSGIENTGGGDFRESDVHLLGRVINGEARGEPYIGQVAVGAVVLNRVRHPSFPNTLAGVVYQPGAFTAIDDGQIHVQLESEPTRAAQDALNGWDPTDGCIYYYNPVKTTNQWIWSRPVMTVIGSHRFAK